MDSDRSTQDRIDLVYSGIIDGMKSVNDLCKNNAKFNRLWYGDDSDFENNESDADSSFISSLIKKGLSDEQIDLCFRASNRYRAKWERRDYQERTIRKAREFLGIQYTDSTQEWQVKDIFANFDPTSIEPRQWLTNHLCRQYITVLHAAGGTGKTAYALAEGLSLAMGRPLIGEKVHKRGKVLYVTAEDGEDEMRRRLYAAQLCYVSEAFEPGWFHTLVLTGQDAALATVEDKGTLKPTKAVEYLEKNIKRLGIDAVIFDPLIKLAGVSENNNNEVDFVMRLLAGIATRCNVAIMLLHHVRKGVSSAGDADMARGAKALIDAARLTYSLSTMTEKEAKSLDVSPAERRSLIRLDNSKSNLMPPSTGATWFKMVSIPLGNCTEEYPDGDYVQALQPWQPDTPVAGKGGLPPEVVNAIFEELDKGQGDGVLYSDNNAAKDRSAWKIIKKHVPEKPEQECKDLIKLWVEKGVLRVVEFHNKKRGETQFGLRINRESDDEGELE